MLRLTNKYDYPAEIFDAVELIRNQYDPGQSDNRRYITVTQLVQPEQAYKLAKQAGVLEVDVREMGYTMAGSIVHGILEQLQHHPRYADNIFERRMYGKLAGWDISGQVDMYCPATKTITDWKYTSLYTFKDGEMKREWRQQLNLLAWLMRQNGYEVEGLRLVAMARDHSSRRAHYKGDYPQDWCKVLWAKKHKQETIEGWLRVRLASLDSDDLPECSEDDRWPENDGKRWAAVKVGKNGQLNKRATKLFATADECLAWIDEHSDADTQYQLQGREVSYIRCETYCAVRQICRQAINEGSQHGA